MKEFVESLLLLYHDEIIGKDTIVKLLYFYVVTKYNFDPMLEIKYIGQKEE